jgi:predicted nucleic acid-binding protein
VPVFVDTNVFVYASSLDDSGRHDPARAWVDHLWRTGQGRLSTQILQEFYAVTTRKLGGDTAIARSEARDLAAWSTVPVDMAVIEGAWIIEDRYGLAFWDALVASAAHVARCEALLTEDLQDGMDLDGVIVVDPFLHPPGATG